MKSGSMALLLENYTKNEKNRGNEVVYLSSSAVR